MHKAEGWQVIAVMESIAEKNYFLFNTGGVSLAAEEAILCRTG